MSSLSQGGTEKHRLYHCPECFEITSETPEACRKFEQKAETSKEEWMCQRGIVEQPLKKRQWNRGHFGEAPKLGHASTRLQRSRCHGRLSSG